MQARYYDPVAGRFLSTDPIGYQDQLNLYAYVGNDPVNATDPTGEFANILIGGVAGAAVGTVFEGGRQLLQDGKISDPGAVRRSAIVGAASGALGPAGGTLARAALVGRGVASASKAASAIPSGRALVAVTDLAADLAGQPLLGAVDAALANDDPGTGALQGVTATGGSALGEAAFGGRAAQSTAGQGARGALAATLKSVGKQLIKNTTAKSATESMSDPNADSKHSHEMEEGN